MRYEVYQKFESIGDPGREVYPSRAMAEDAARTLREEIAVQVSELEVDVDADGTDLGSADECAAWDHAAKLANGGATYGSEAGAYIADRAVVLAELA
jgi:hypothetical protein